MKRTIQLIIEVETSETLWLKDLEDICNRDLTLDLGEDVQILSKTVQVSNTEK